MISKSTCQLLSIKTGTKAFPIANGCSVLIEFNEKFYCISNAHVLVQDNDKKPFFLVGNGRNLSIGGDLYFSKPLQIDNKIEDNYDIAVTLLDNDTIKGIKKRGFIFMHIEDIKTGHKISENDQILFVGYPASKTKINVTKRQVISNPFFFLTKPISKNIKKINFPIDYHVIAKYSRNKITNFLVNYKSGPSPRGMSGSGIWLITEIVNGFKANLIGVLSEYHENRSLLIGTKIDLYLSLIKQRMDANIPNNGIRIDIIK